jgi:signal transduction histidine kinase
VTSTRVHLFAALAASVLLGALATGLYAVALDARTIGFVPRLASVAPKAFVLASGLLLVAAGGAALAGRRLARPAEELAEAAGRIAEGLPWTPMPRTRNGEAVRIARALVSLRSEVASRPYAAAFLRDAWHDLKTPLAAIRATLEVLEDGAVDDPVAARRFLSNLSRAADDLDRKLGDLVTLARLETASVDERTASLADVIGQAIEQVAPLAAARGVALREVGGEATSRVRCDASAIGRALSNLLENAVDATPGGGAGGVSVSVDAHGKDAVFVDVINEPACVPREVRGHLFERAVTARRPGSDRGRGTGLGLAIARAAVEAHGGRVTFVEMGPPRVRVRVELPR